MFSRIPRPLMVFLVPSLIAFGALGAVKAFCENEGSLPPASVYGKKTLTLKIQVTGFIKYVYPGTYGVFKNDSDSNNESLAFFKVEDEGDQERGKDGLLIKEALNKEVVFEGVFREVIVHGKVDEIVCTSYTLKLSPWQIAAEKREAEAEEEKVKRETRVVSVGYLDPHHMADNDLVVCQTQYLSENTAMNLEHGRYDRYHVVAGTTIFTGLQKSELEWYAWKKVRVKVKLIRPGIRIAELLEITPVQASTPISISNSNY